MKKKYAVHYGDGNWIEVESRSLLGAKQQATRWAPALKTIRIYDEEGENLLATRRFWDSGEGWWQYHPWE